MDEQPCLNPQGHDASDLCAEWRAADAAERSSRWGWYQLFLSAFGIVGLLLTLLFNFEAWSQARESKGDTATALKHAETSAKAMERVADSMKINAKKVAESVKNQELFGRMQMRAYVSVLTDGIPQDENHIFEARPIIRNTGHTPAHSVKWRIKADILPFPLPDDFAFPLPDDAPGQGILNPQQTGFMSAFLDGFENQRVPEADVEAIKRCNGRAFYTWGIVTYRDAFGVNRHTKFAYLMTWNPTGAVDDNGKPVEQGQARYLRTHNEAD